MSKKKLKVIVGDRAAVLTEEQLEMYNGLTKLQKSVSLKKLQGLSDVDAYLAGNGKAKSDNSRRASASEILTNPNVVAFIESFNSQIVSQAIMGREEMLERLTLMARSNVTDLVEINNNVVVDDPEQGKIMQSFWSLKDKENMPEGALSSIHELTSGKEGLKIKVHDQKAAMKQIADLEGFNAATRLAVGGDPDAPPIKSEDVPNDPLEAARVYQEMLGGKK